MKRADAIAWIRIAGYHNDSKAFTRLLIENRVSREAANTAWSSGIKAKAGGMGCTCHHCKKPQDQKA